MTQQALIDWEILNAMLFFVIAASVKSIMESTEKLCSGNIKLKVGNMY